ncbi:MAG: hypothetical protein ACPGO5_03110 [Patescibacteria group bacterium]
MAEKSNKLIKPQRKKSEDLGTPVDVLAFFESGMTDPIKFRYNGKVYSVKRVLRNQVKLNKQYFFISTKESDEEEYRLVFNRESFRWYLKKLQK